MTVITSPRAYNAPIDADSGDADARTVDGTWYVVLAVSGNDGAERFAFAL